MQPKNFYASLYHIERGKGKLSIGLKKFSSAERAILTTLLYSDIFSFPLTKDELWKFLISEQKITIAEFNSGLNSLKSIVCQDGYYCLLNRKKIITERKKNLSEVAKKMKRAQSVSKKLSIIPSILFIGVSGGLAAGNATQKDDIDLVIIAKKDTLFATRFLVLSILQALGVRRSRNQKETADTICVNLLLDETAIGWFENKKDIYIAREMAQMLPLFERDNFYRRFINSNKWIKEFLPNIIIHKFISKTESHPGKRRAYRIISRFWTRFVARRASQNDNYRVNLINIFFEWLFRSFQMNWMKRHQTNEVITMHMLAFHPNNYRTLTLKNLRLKMQQFGLLTKF